MTPARPLFVPVVAALAFAACTRPTPTPTLSEVSISSASAPRRSGGGAAPSPPAAGVSARSISAAPPDMTADAIIAEAVQFGPPEERRQDLLAWYRLVDERPWYVDRALLLVELKKPAVPEKTWALVIAVRNPQAEPPSKRSTRWHTPRHYHGEPFGVEWYRACPTAAEVDAFLKERQVDFEFGAPSSGFRFIDNGVAEDVWRARFGAEMPYAFAR